MQLRVNRNLPLCYQPVLSGFKCQAPFSVHKREDEITFPLAHAKNRAMGSRSLVLTPSMRSFKGHPPKCHTVHFWTLCSDAGCTEVVTLVLKQRIPKPIMFMPGESVCIARHVVCFSVALRMSHCLFKCTRKTCFIEPKAKTQTNYFVNRILVFHPLPCPK